MVDSLFSSQFLLGLVVGGLLFFPIGWLASWQVRSWQVRNYALDPKGLKNGGNDGYLLTPKKHKNLTRQIFTFSTLILFIINLYLFWVANTEIPAILQFVFGLAAAQALNVNIVEPLIEKTLQVVSNRSKMN